MSMGKARIYAYVAEDIRDAAISVMRPGESLSDVVQAALLAEIGRRQAAGTGTPAATSTTGGGKKLPPGKRPKVRSK